jgi:small-conductance mechanosensitive channel
MSTKRFSRQGFQQLHNTTPSNMANPNDVTINIPMTPVPTPAPTGARKAEPHVSSMAYRSSNEFAEQTPNEKAGLFHRTDTGLGRRRKLEQKGLAQKDEDDGTLTSMGKVYTKILHFSVVTRYFLYVLPLALLIAVPIIIGATAARNTTIAGVQITWFFTWFEVVWLGIWVAKLFAQALPWIFQFLCGIVSSGTRKYALILKALEIPISLVGWAAISLSTFTPLMTLNPYARKINDTKTKDWQATVRNILLAGFFSSLVFLGERLLVQLISISYHRKQFDNKIKDSKRNVHFLGLLYDASRALFPAYCPEFAAEDYLINDSIDASIKVGSGNRSGSATPMRLIQNVGANVGRVGDKITAAFGNVAQEITGKQVFNPTSAHSIVVEALEKTSSSEALARRLWMSFVMEGREALYQDDIVDVLGAERTTEAEECFACLDRDGNGDISLDEMILAVCEFGRERHSIASSMHDVDQAIHVLNNLLLVVAFIISIFIFVGFINKNFTTTLATAGTALLSLSFVFAVTCQEVLGSCIFLFVKHPFDVGDRVDIGESQLVVERISLLFTVFRKVKDHKTTQVPNIILNSNWIDNITRSKAMREQVLLYINFDTTLEDIQLLKSEMAAFVLDKDNNRDFQPDVDIEVTGIHEMNKLELKIEIRHKSNWSNEAVRASRRSKFMCALVLALRKIPIYGPGAGDAALGDVGKPTYAVTISDEQAAANKKEFSDNKDKKRMIPKNVEEDADASVKSPENPPTGKSTSVDYLGGIAAPRGLSTQSASTVARAEASILETLNARPAALDPAHDDTNKYYKATEDVALAKTESRRSQDIEEVRGLLRKESSRGRRKVASPTNGASIQSPTATIDEVVSPPPRSASRPGAAAGQDFHEYAFTAPSSPPPPPSQPQLLPMTALPQWEDREAGYPTPQPGQQRPRAGSGMNRRPVGGGNANVWPGQGQR